MKEFERKEMERMAALIAEAERNPLTKKFREEEAAVTLAMRTEAAGKIKVLQSERSAVIPKLQADVEAKEAKYKTAKAVLDAAGSEFQSARAALSNEGNSFDTDIRNQEAILYETANPRIDEGIEFFRAKLGWLRSPGRISRIAGGAERNIFTWKKTVKEESNEPAVRDALAYCQSAIKALEQMKLAPGLDMEKIEGLKAGVPSIDVYTEFVGGKPMEKQAPTFIPPSDYEDLQIDRLLKKTV